MFPCASPAWLPCVTCAATRIGQVAFLPCDQQKEGWTVGVELRARPWTSQGQKGLTVEIPRSQQKVFGLQPIQLYHATSMPYLYQFLLKSSRTQIASRKRFKALKHFIWRLRPPTHTWGMLKAKNDGTRLAPCKLGIIPTTNIEDSAVPKLTVVDPHETRWWSMMIYDDHQSSLHMEYMEYMDT